MPRHDQGHVNPPDPPPIWELPEPPTLWTRLKHRARQQAKRWRGDHTRPDQPDQRTEPPSGTGQVAPRTRRGEDTASLRPPAATSAEAYAGDELDISSEVLESAYEAVRQGHISDPDTIRQLATRLAHFPMDDESGPDLPFDPHEAARRLRQRAAEIARQRGLGDEEDPPPTKNGEGSNSGGPHRGTPRMERDENITRGG